jgi:hypothetical protein
MARKSQNSQQPAPKPYAMVSLPKKSPKRHKPIGQDAFKPKRLSGTISLRLTVKTTAFVASGVVAMGDDVPNLPQKRPLIKVAVTRDRNLIIPGSSLKGVVRSTYEAMTQSCLCKTKAKKETIPSGYRECDNKNKLCPACQVFGAMNWQGLISFQDAIACEMKPSIGFMPSLYAPRQRCREYYKKERKNDREYVKVAGRKFYYHADKSVDKGKQGIPVQQAGTDLTFATQLRFMNLTEAEFGTLAIALGQDQQYRLALKVGGGKPIGMGTMLVDVTEVERSSNLRDRYLNYEPPASDRLSGDELQSFINKTTQIARQQLVQERQLQELAEVLKFPANRTAPEGVY